MKLYLDDVRDPTDASWALVRAIDEAKASGARSKPSTPPSAPGILPA